MPHTPHQLSTEFGAKQQFAPPKEQRDLSVEQPLLGTLPPTDAAAPLQVNYPRCPPTLMTRVCVGLGVCLMRAGEGQA